MEMNDDMQKMQGLTTDSLVRVCGEEGHTLLILPVRQLWMWALSWPEKESHEERNTSSIQLIDKLVVTLKMMKLFVYRT